MEESKDIVRNCKAVQLAESVSAKGVWSDVEEPKWQLFKYSY